MIAISKRDRIIVIMVVATGLMMLPVSAAAVPGNPLIDDARLLARIAEGEAEVLGEEGMLAVMWVARNRVGDDRFPNDYEAVSKAFYGRRRGDAKFKIVTLALAFLAKPQREDPTGRAIYAYSLADVRWWTLPTADAVVPDEPVAGRWQLHLYEGIDWVAWREARKGRCCDGD